MGTLKEQLARLMMAADGPEAPTVLRDLKADCQLKHCVKELPSAEEVNAVVVAESPERATRIKVVKQFKALELPSGDAATAPDQSVLTE